MPTDEQYILAFDLGSGGPKAALVSDCGRIVAHTRRPCQVYILPGGGAEQDPDEWWQAISQAACELVGRRVVPPERIVAVSCASQWSVTVPVDRGGRHLARAVHWMDSRGAPYTQAITGGWPKVAGYGARRMLRWVRMTGGVPTHAGVDALAHMLYLMHERPDVYRQTDKLLEPMDYINLRLTGRAAASHGTVYPYLLTDNRDNLRIDYDPVLLGWSGLDRAKLPDLVPVDAVLGPLRPEVAEAWGLPRTTQVVAGTSDSQVAVLGSGAVADFDVHACVGTSAWMSCHLPYKKTDLLRYLATMPAAVRGRNMLVGEQGPAGKCLELVAERLLFADDEITARAASPEDLYAQVERLAAAVPAGSGGLVFLPWLNGAGPPSGDGNTRGGFFNQSLRTTRAEMCRAVLEGVAYNLRWLLEAVEGFVGRKVPRVNFIGGGGRIELWGQILADVLDRPVVQVADTNLAIVRGAALAGWLALKRIRVDEIPAKVEIARTFQPQPEHREIYEELFAAFLACYKSNKRTYARLSRLRLAGR